MPGFSPSNRERRLAEALAACVLLGASSLLSQVAGFTFDNRLDDLAGQGHLATRMGQFGACGPSSDDPPCPDWVTDRVGADRHALELDGAEEYIDLQYDTAPPIDVGGDFSLAAWVRFSSPVGPWQLIVELGGGPFQDNLLLGRSFSSNQMIFDAWLGASSLGACTTPGDVIVADEWAHFVGTWRAGEQKIYKNGVEVASCSAPGVPARTPRANSWVGRSNWEDNANFAGGIDEVWIYDHALSESEVVDLYASGTPLLSGVAAYYAFDDNFSDGSGWGRHGTFVGDVDFFYNFHGDPGGAAWFDRTPDAPLDYLQIPDPQISGEFTISAWVKMHGIRDWARIVDLGNGEQQDNIVFARFGTTSDLAAVVFDGITNLGGCVATGAIDDHLTNPDISPWIHFAVTWKDGEQRIYKYGELIQECSIAGAPAAAPRNSSFVGRSNWAENGEYRGAIDELWIIDRALPAEDIARFASITPNPCIDDEWEYPIFTYEGVDYVGDDDECGWNYMDIGAAQAHSLCDRDLVWLSDDMIPGETYRIETTNLDPGTDTTFELYADCGSTLLATDDNGGPGAGSRLDIVPQESTLHHHLHIQQKGGNEAFGNRYTLSFGWLIFADGFESGSTSAWSP